MKKLLTIVAVALISFSLQSATLSVSVAGSSAVNVLSNSFTATQFVLTAAANNVGTVKLYDAPTGVLTNIVPSYITSGAYGTNYITSYTNYFGVQNNFTNVALVHYSITNSATTNTYPLVLAINAGTNATVNLQGVTYNFNRGLTVTNAGAAAATIGVTYVQ